MNVKPHSNGSLAVELNIDKVRLWAIGPVGVMRIPIDAQHLSLTASRYPSRCLSRAILHSPACRKTRTTLPESPLPCACLSATCSALENDRIYCHGDVLCSRRSAMLVYLSKKVLRIRLF